MTYTRSQQAISAIELAAQVRDDAGLDFSSPLCIFDLSEELGFAVRFLDMKTAEGMYATGPGLTPTIVVSALRPPQRQAFTCAHELGHHFFEHGFTVDEFQRHASQQSKLPNELSADNFAAHLLMPRLGLADAFTRRGWEIRRPTPVQLLTVSSHFGVGYDTLITHLAAGLNLLSEAHAENCRKERLPAMRAEILGHPESSRLLIIDHYYALPTLDAEVGDVLVFTPHGATCESPALEQEGICGLGHIFRAKSQGTSYIRSASPCQSVLVRVSPKGYVGLAKYRHLEE